PSTLHDGGRCRVCRGELSRPRPRGPGGGHREGARPRPSRPVSLLPRGIPRPRPRDRERVRRDAPPADAGVVPRAGGDRLHGAVVPGVREVPPVRGTVPPKGGGRGAVPVPYLGRRGCLRAGT